MSDIATRIAKMLDILPEADKELAYAMVKKLVLAWDPDFTKVTPEEAASLEQAMKEVESGDFVGHDAINWN